MMYLEDFMELIESLPEETRQRLSEIRQLDLQVRNGLEAFTHKTESFFARCLTSHDTSLRDREFTKIKQEFANIASECDEKVQIAQQHHDLLERYLKKIDQEIQKFKMELEADNAGITGQIEERFKEAERSLDQFIIDHAKVRSDDSRARFGSAHRDTDGENGDGDLRHSDVDSPFIPSNQSMGMPANGDGDADMDFNSYHSQFFGGNNFDTPSQSMLGAGSAAPSGSSQHSHSLRNACAPKGRYAALHAGASHSSAANAAGGGSNTGGSQISSSAGFSSYPTAYSGANTPLNNNAFETASVSSSTNTNGTRKRPKAGPQLGPAKKIRNTNAGSHFYGNQYTGSLKPKSGKQQYGTPSFSMQSAFGSPQTNLTPFAAQSNTSNAYQYQQQFSSSFNSGYPDPPSGWPTAGTSNQTPAPPGVNPVAEFGSPGDDAIEYYDADGTQEDTRLYCFCQRVSFGNMVACDSDNCKFEWFHYDCVGLTAAPKGKWYCENCAATRKQRNKQTGASSSAPRATDAGAGAAFSRKPGSYKHNK